MATIADVQQALLDAYATLDRVYPDWVGKSSEGMVGVHYPSLWKIRDGVDPGVSHVSIWAYALGPSREHHFVRAERNAHPNYYTWESRDPLAEAVRVIKEWEADLLKGREEDDAVPL